MATRILNINGITQWYLLKVHHYHGEKIKFLVGGCWNVFFGNFIFVCLDLWLSPNGVSYQSIFLITQIPAITSAFLVYKFFVFKSSNNAWGEYYRFIFSYCLLAAANLILLTVLVEFCSIQVLISQAIATVIVVILSYLSNKYFTFRGKVDDLQIKKQRSLEDLMVDVSRGEEISIKTVITRIANKINSSGPVFLGIFVACYLVVNCYRAERKLLWYDEIYTLYISKLPDFQALLDALKHGVDFNPPLFYLWVRFSEIFFGFDALGIRMPAIFGFGMLCLCLYRFVSIRTNVIGGVVACLFPLITGGNYYSFEARPHGMVIGLAGLALICWQSAADPQQAKLRIWWLGGMMSALICATLTHGYAMVIFVPLAIGELVRNINNKKVDYIIWICLGIASISLLGPFMMMQIVKQALPPTFWPAKFMIVINSYQSNLGNGKYIVLLVIMLLLGKVLINRPLRLVAVYPSALPKHEFAACLTFVLVPFLVYLLSIITGAPQIPRYGLTCILGFSALIGVFVTSNTNNNYNYLGVGSIMLLTVLIAKDTFIFSRLNQMTEPSSELEISTDKAKYLEHFRIMSNSSDKTSPLVIFSTWDFSPEFHYAPPELRERLTILYWDQPNILQSSYMSLQNCCHAYGQFAELHDFVKNHKNFVAVIYNFNRLQDLQSLAKMGAEITLQQVDTQTALFAVKFP